MLLMLSPDPNSRATSSDLYKKMEVLRPTKFHSNDRCPRLSPVPGSASQVVGRNLVCSWTAMGVGFLTFFAIFLTFIEKELSCQL